MKIEKRVVNIPKESFDIIKEYCEKNSLDMVSWMTKNLMDKISMETDEEMISPSQLNVLREKTRNTEFPKDWLQIVIKDIKSKLISHVTSGETENKMIWMPSFFVRNNYEGVIEFKLNEIQVKRVSEELNDNGFVLSLNTSHFSTDIYYVITW